MSNEDLLIAASTMWVAQNGGTHGSPVGPLLHAVDASTTAGLPPGKARLRPQAPETALSGEEAA
jgi:hypothetical protein